MSHFQNHFHGISNKARFTASTVWPFDDEESAESWSLGVIVSPVTSKSVSPSGKLLGTNKSKTWVLLRNVLCMDLFHLQLFLQTPEEMTPVAYMKGHEIRRVCHVRPTFNLTFEFTVSFISPVFVGGWCCETTSPHQNKNGNKNMVTKPQSLIWKYFGSWHSPARSVYCFIFANH